jgi:hypothetical protein
MSNYMYPNSKISPGYNNVGALVAWESLYPSGDQRFFAPIIYGRLNPGQKVYDLDGMPFFRGYAAVLNGEFSVITQAQLYYLKTTYLGGSYGGQVTMAIRMENWATYVNVNAIFDLSTMDTMKKTSQAWAHYTFNLRKVITL